tara:strand:- start:511 stop:2895 length:2385 start_codon:yes stop_codon:yes gene_type:complete
MASKQEQEAKSLKAIIEEQNKLLREQIKIDKERLATDKGITSEQQDISNVLKDQLTQLKFQKAEKAQIRKITNSITKISEELTSLGKEDLLSARQIKKFGQDRLSLDKNIRSLIQLQNKLKTETVGLTDTEKELNLELAESLQDQINNAIALKVELGQVNQITENIAKNKGVSLFGGIGDVLDKVPVLSGLAPMFSDASKEAEKVAADLEKRKFGVEKFKELVGEGMDFEDALEAAGTNIDDIAAYDAGELTKAKINAEGMSTATTSFKNNLKKSLGPITLLALGAQQLVSAIIKTDKQVEEMAQGMNMTYNEAAATRAELTDMAFASGNTLVNSNDLANSLTFINASMGTGVQLSEEMLVQFTEMREMAGMTNEELIGIANISAATGKEINDITGEFMAQAKISSLQQGVLVNEKELLKEINNVSAATTLSFGKNPKLIGEAVATAKALGMELSKVEGIADSMLDFESSITAELEAELLLNKDISLERARQAALNNDLATVAKEISEQIGSSAEFSEMNRIQQEALAQSVGMNRDSLAETLFVQEQLAGLTGEQADEEQAILQNRIAAVGLEQAQKELAKDGIEGLRQQVGLATRFEKVMEKIQEIFVMLAEPLLMITDLLSPILNIVGLVMKHAKQIGESFSGIGGVVLAMIPILMKASLIARSFAILGFKGAVAALFRTFAAIPFGLGIPLAIAGVAGLSALMKKGVQAVGDLKIDPNGGPIVASPNMGGIFQGRKDDALRMGNQQALDNPSVVQQDNSKVENLLSQMITVQKATLKKTPEVAPLGLYEVQ